MATICGHDAEPSSYVACPHVFDPETRTVTPYVRHFTGIGASYRCLCKPCSATVSRGGPVDAGPLCRECYEEIDMDGVGWAGNAAVIERPCAFVPTTYSTDIPARLLPIEDLAPLDTAVPTWLVLTQSGVIVRWEPDTGTMAPLVRTLLRAEPERTGRDKFAGRRLGLKLFAARDGRHAVVALPQGPNGEVFDLTTGERVMELTSGSYHQTHSRASVAFFERDDHNLLVHRTGWNRLDVTDLDTGTLLTERPAEDGTGTPAAGRHASVFCGAVHVSPGATRLLHDGWVWGSAGVIDVWDIAPWLEGNPFEAMTGPSSAVLRQWEDWNVPMVWLDEHRIALGGLAVGYEPPMPGARVLDLRGRSNGRSMMYQADAATFVGPVDGRGGFFSAHGLLYASDRAGLAIWDPADGARLGGIEGFRPTHHHPFAGELVEVVDGRIVRWRIADPLAD